MALAPSLHQAIKVRLGDLDQRYTPLRRVLVETLAGAARPLTIPEIRSVAPELPQSSAYRNLTVLIEAGVVRRVSGSDDHGRFELDEHFSGHHHHFVCSACGRVDDVAPSRALERALGAAVREMTEGQGYQVEEHRIELVGICPDCASSPAR